MKLLDIKPITLEADADDEFAAHVMPTDRTAQIRLLLNKEAAIQRNIHMSGSSDKSGDALKRQVQLDALVRRVRAEIRRLEKEETIEKTTAIKQGGGAVTPNIPESSIPAKLNAGQYKFGNPYFQGVDNRYAGDPRQFTWTPQMHKQYVRLNHMLTDRGLAGFTLIYASTARVRNANLSNFALFGAGGKVIWRKYDMGYASGKNLIYIDGVKHEVRSLMLNAMNDPAKVDAALAPIVKTS
jgi:hypothetical protein